jgi:UDP-glucose 4-epimerase
VIDNLSNSKRVSLERVEKIVGQEIPFVKCDILDKEGLRAVFSQYKISCVIHFAGLKAVGESCQKPLDYYSNNISGTLCLLEVMKEFSCKNMIFSSSATVYGNPQYLPLDENHPLSCTNPYGRTKLFIEDILRDLHVSDTEWNIVILRYFNPTGAEQSGTIGEDPNGIPNNLMPYISQVAVGRRPELNVFGSDYETKDGTGVRDFIHVVDLSIGHCKAVIKINENCGCKVYNLGTGTGYSVLEMVKAMEVASEKEIPYKLTDRRPGDIASCFADPALARDELQWVAVRGLKEMCDDMWRWQKLNPDGFP